MHVLRPIRESDLPALVALAGNISGGLTTLPPDESFLRDRIDDSLRAFSPKIKKAGAENYLFVLEDTASGLVVGTSGISARVGGYEPFYSYQLRRERHAHAALDVDREIDVLHLRQLHRGPTEIGSLCLHPAHRRGGLGRLLSLARFLFIGAFPARFDSTVIAELRGYLDQRGLSPFWEAVGRHFFGHDFYTADVLSGLGDKAFIADLMPRHPIYVPLLAPEVRAVIGKVHHDTSPALALLRAEGFSATDEVDIFDAGPQLRAPAGSIRTVRERRSTTFAVGEPLRHAPPCLLANDSLEFRAAVAPFDPADPILSPALAQALGLSKSVSFAPLRHTSPPPAGSTGAFPP
jgi:arginine N-succinyltransferase